MLDLLIAAPAGALQLEACLRALAPQCARAPAEARVTVAHAGPRPPIGAAYPAVRWLAAEPGATLPQLWGQALAATDGDWVAILDAECPAGAGWLSAALDLCARGDDLYGGAVEPRALRSRTEWAAYFCDYGAFMRPLAPGAAAEVAGNNLLLRRALLARAPQYAAPEFWKAHFVRALQAQGVAALNAPDLVVHYERRYTARGWLQRRQVHARCFAAMRVAGATWPVRLTFALLAPALPTILLLRLLRRVLPKGRHRPEFWLSLPWIVAGLSAWAAGEWQGYALGEGNACAQIL